jgi:Alginate export
VVDLYVEVYEMKQLRRIGTVVVCASVFVCGEYAFAQSKESTTETKTTKPKAGPKFLDLRYNEDFSYLDGAEGTYQEDYFDSIKNIHLDDDWTLSIGGEFRYRMEAETNLAYGARRRSQDTFSLFRYMLHADFKYRDRFRVFVQGISAMDEDRQLPPRAADENKWDLHQLFFDYKLLGPDLPLTIRVGRQELRYGNERLLSPFRWGNVRRRFQGVKLFAHGDNWDVDMWWVKPMPVQRKQRDRVAEDTDFWGVYATYKAMKNHGLDLYFFALDDTSNQFSKGELVTNPNGKSGDRDIYTLGARFWGKPAPWDYEFELAGQWGHWAGDTVQAWMFAIDAGYTFADIGCKPRVGMGFDWASGDEDPFDGKVGTFNQLFPLGHKYFGFLDLIGRQNINAFNMNIAANLAKDVKGRIAYHYFWLNAEKDSLYNAGGAATRRDPTGNSGRGVGQELDLTVKWKIDAHSHLLAGYSHMWDSGFLITTGGYNTTDDPDLFYLQYGFKF